MHNYVNAEILMIAFIIVERVDFSFIILFYIIMYIIIYTITKSMHAF